MNNYSIFDILCKVYLMKKYSQNSQTRERDIILYKNRIKKINHIWVDQILNLIIKSSDISKGKYKINDIGCNLFQFYKGIKRKKISKRFDYFGYDHDKEYIKQGLKFFPELKKKSKVLNIEKNFPRKTDISVISATLEHLIDSDKSLENILKSTKKKVFIRTFLGKKKIVKLFKNKKYVDNPYHINQFSFNWIEKKLKKHNFFDISFIKDMATKGKTRTVWPSVKRKFYILQADKRQIN